MQQSLRTTSLEILVVCNKAWSLVYWYLGKQLLGDSKEQPRWRSVELSCKGQETRYPFDLSLAYSILKLSFVGFVRASVLGAAEGMPKKLRPSLYSGCL